MERIIAIGDIHGCSRTLATLLEMIQPTSADTIVTLGDYINRGPDSKGVVEHLLDLRKYCTLVPLLGNHEDMLLSVLDGGYSLDFFLRFGGRQTLESYGVHHPRGIPDEHIAFLERCGTSYVTVNHFFVHAYYEPRKPLSEQPWGTLVWASPPENPERHISGKTAIIGHTAQMSGQVLDLGFLKGIDTGCGLGGSLTALDVQSGRVWQVKETESLHDVWQ